MSPISLILFFYSTTSIYLKGTVAGTVFYCFRTLKAYQTSDGNIRYAKNRRFIRLSGFSAFPLCRVVIYAYLRSMKHRIVPYLFLVATLCMGCGGRLSMRELEHLEARMNDAPDSVLRVSVVTASYPAIAGDGARQIA